MMLRNWALLALSAIPAIGQTQPAALIQVRPEVAAPSMRDGQVTTVFLAPRYVTAIRVPEAGQFRRGWRPVVIFR